MHRTFGFLLLLLFPGAVQGQQPAPQGYVPPKGFVPDSATAVRIAVAVWIPIYARAANLVGAALHGHPEGGHMDSDREPASGAQGISHGGRDCGREDRSARWPDSLCYSLSVTARPNQRLKLTARID